MKREKEERVRHIIKWQLVDLIFANFSRMGAKRRFYIPRSMLSLSR